MKTGRQIVLILFLQLIYCVQASSAEELGKSEPIVIPSGTTMIITLADPIDTSTATNGDNIRAFLKNDVTVAGKVYLPAGTSISGSIVNVVHKSTVDMIGMDFNSLLLSNGQKVDVGLCPKVRHAQIMIERFGTTIFVNASEYTPNLDKRDIPAKPPVAERTSTYIYGKRKKPVELEAGDELAVQAWENIRIPRN
jgi:translation initiation factor IF-1